MDQDIPQLAAAIRAGEASAKALIRDAIDRVRLLDPALGSFITLDADGALEAAGAVDRRVAAGEDPGPLAGVPVGVKDQLLTRGLETTAGSRILAGFRPLHDATAVARLRAAGAVVLGKLNQDEFAMGSSNEHSSHGPCRNPWDTTRTPGGSSGGSAAAVAAGLCAGALGTDTGGSIRQPASLCGVVGLKPTYGRVSRFGAIAFASSLDQIGPFARSVRGAAALFGAIAGSDPHDATSAEAPVPAGLDALPRDADLRGVRVGMPRQYFPSEGLDGAVDASVRAAIAQLEALGAEIVEVDLPHTEYAVATYYIVATAEASSNLGRYDGVRYGLRTPAGGLHETYAATREAGFGTEVKRRIMLGTFVLSAGYYDAYYRKASQVRTLIRRDFEAAFGRVDVIATPTSPTTAFPLGQRTSDPLSMYLADIFTLSCNLAGLPGLSVPCGFDGDGLPIGLQLLGRPFDEAGLLRVAAAYEDATDWSARRPPEPVMEGSA
jgi:aspartyl-tRNA(Asn)/glutamyl-tRNA(Gln) amidotransferase subunit A